MICVCFYLAMHGFLVAFLVFLLNAILSVAAKGYGRNQLERKLSCTKQVEAGRAKPGSLLMVKGFPCEVIDYTLAKTGKHGPLIALVSAEDILTGKKYHANFGIGDMIPAPIVRKQEYFLMDVSYDWDVITVFDDGEAMDLDTNLNRRNEAVRKVFRDMIRAYEEGRYEILVTVLTLCNESEPQQYFDGYRLGQKLK